MYAFCACIDPGHAPAMATSAGTRDLPAVAGGPAAGQADRITGVALMTGSAASSQLGAATAALAFPVLGPAGVVAIRQWVAAAVLLTTVRPRFSSFTRQQWRPVLALALIFATMNLSLYLAIDRIGLGLAVTLEFLGPLSVALLASRRVIDLGCALVAGAAAVVLARPQPSTDYAGIGLAVLAATCWAGYILVNRVVGARLPGSQGPAAAASLSALLYVPVGIWVLAGHPVTATAVGRAATAGLLCSAIPMVADLLALRRVPARFYGVFMSVNPVFAALTGLVVLGQSLAWLDWLAIAAIVTANAVGLSTGARAQPSGSVAEGGRAPAVDGHDGTGHEGRIVRRQERRDAGHFLGLRLAADGLQGGVRFPPRHGSGALGGREGCPVAAHVGVDVPGADGVDAKTVGAVVDGQLPGEVDDAALGGTVRRGQRRADDAVGGGNVDHGASRLPQEVRDGRPGTQEGPAQVDGDRPVPGVDVELMEATRAAGDARVVDQHVESAEVGDGAVDQGGDLFGIGHVA
jgi:inner membrane transporter RhtA